MRTPLDMFLLPIAVGRNCLQPIPIHRANDHTYGLSHPLSIAHPIKLMNPLNASKH